MNPITSNIQKMAFLRQPIPFTLVEMMDFVKKLPGGGLPIRMGREARPIVLGSKMFVRLIILDLVFCLFKFIYLGFHLVKKIIF